MSKIQIEYLPIEDLREYENNTRQHGETDIAAIKKSIIDFGMCDPIGIWGDDNIIVEGHGRLKALQTLGHASVPCIRLDHLTDAQRKAYAIAHNKTAELSEWDFDKLETELAALAEMGVDMDGLGFDLDYETELEGNDNNADDEENKTLETSFIFPPFSVLDGRSGKWQDRKREWLAIGIDSGDGRGDDLLGGLRQCAEKYGVSSKSGISATGTSVFDPVLCEIMLKWFSPHKSSVFDPFAGGSVRGIVASILGYDYTGIDLRQEQIDANISQAEKIGVAPKWICDDSKNADLHVADESVDFVFSCPPYADLEVYSDDPRDLSTMDYNEFLNAYREIIEISVKKLKNDRFAVFVVGDVRDKNGFYRDFISDTKRAFIEAGAMLYNEIIKLDALATAPIRAAMLFKNRKVVKVHQNVLIFYKGDAKNIRANFGEIEVADVSDYQKIIDNG